MTTPVPGWYDAPDGSAMLRWWDGTTWTADVSPRPSAVAAPTPIQAPVPAAPAFVAPPLAPPPAVPLAPYAPARKRLVWPWVAGGVALLVIIIGAVVAIAWAVGRVVDAGNSLESSSQGAGTVLPSASPTDPTGAAAAVTAFDRAYADEDCDELTAVTTPDFRDSLGDSAFTCEAWLDVASSYTVDGTYLYSVAIDGAEITGAGTVPTAVVTTTEVDSSMPEPQTTHWTYDLILTDGAWLIDDQTSTDD
ncbi:DUF2510 domain-containing protein [Glaciihabitans sp. dw_435]|uniref:DUF2510 domain-containing protein n=1 Tax=Glaciihabitans sp. dw_435 TaxID=2720081 RepID=UPI001BD2BF20|nr:DUF2510 domain-containing protein [Glaciihabitans sp. dw_435]